jgi:hypothetical protein
MIPNPKELMEISSIKTPLIGFYDVRDTKPFEPCTKPKGCYFSSYDQWLKGESICISINESSCPGGGYWVGGVMPPWAIKSAGKDKMPLEVFTKSLNQREGFKFSEKLICQWFENLKPYQIENGYVVVGPLKEDQYQYLKTITFYVNPDQLSLLLLGTEYHNSSIQSPAVTGFASGCGQIAALFGDFNTNIPKAVIGATDIAMREHLPADVLALIVNKPMFKQLCELDEKSFLYKHFWKRLKKLREKA